MTKKALYLEKYRLCAILDDADSPVEAQF